MNDLAEKNPDLFSIDNDMIIFFLLKKTFKNLYFKKLFYKNIEL